MDQPPRKKPHLDDWSKMFAETWSTLPSTLDARPDGLCFYRCILHCLSPHVPLFPQGLDYLQGDSLEVLDAINRLRSLYFKFLNQLEKDHQPGELWERVMKAYGTKLPQWKERMSTNVHVLRTLIKQGHVESKDLWADELTIELTPHLFSHILNVQLYIYEGNRQPLIMSSMVAKHKTLVVVELQYENRNHYKVRVPATD